MSLNKSGFEPVDAMVLIGPDRTQEKIGSIYVPDVHKDRQQAAEMKGVIVALGPSAFYDWHPDYRPKVGDRVFFRRYQQVALKEGETDFWFIKDQDLIGVASDSATGKTLAIWREAGSVPVERAA